MLNKPQALYKNTLNMFRVERYYNGKHSKTFQRNYSRIDGNVYLGLKIQIWDHIVIKFTE